ncbi:hypothetical protein C0989_003417 [Termitomyces sp. Mn162]|nr:hypothetical protein C0989_003417 [Termitomyces sp. Mn162]
MDKPNKFSSTFKRCSAGVGTPEYQRQVATPNISKFTAAIIAIAEKNRDEELRALILTTLARLVPLYPTLYRPSYTALSTLVLRFLNGSAPNPTSDSLLRSASRLYTVLHFTGGKIGAANLWRKSLDETLVFGWNAFLALRTTFPSDDSPLVPNRLAKAVLPSLSVVLVTPTESQASDDTSASQRSRKGKKRARGYEGDEVFKLSKEVICPGHTDGRVLFIALEVMRLILRNPNLSSAMQSISARVLLSMLLALPQISPTSLSAEPKLHMDLLQLVQSINTELGSGTSSVLSKSLGLVVRATMVEDNEDTLRDLEILLHPRVPPLVRSLPHVESLSLYRAEESQEEADVREELGLHGAFPHQSKPVEEDIIMGDSVSPETQPVNNIQPVRIAELSPPKPVSSTVANTSSKPQPASLIVPVSVAIERPRLKPLEPKSLPQTVIPQPAVAPAQDERDDEEMPAINMDSDSDEE